MIRIFIVHVPMGIVYNLIIVEDADKDEERDPATQR